MTLFFKTLKVYCWLAIAMIAACTCVLRSAEASVVAPPSRDVLSALDGLQSGSAGAARAAWAGIPVPAFEEWEEDDAPQDGPTLAIHAFALLTVAGLQDHGFGQAVRVGMWLDPTARPRGPPVLA